LIFPDQFEILFGPDQKLKKQYERAYRLFLYKVSGVRISNFLSFRETRRFYLFTEQSEYFSFFTPSSKSLDQHHWTHTLHQQQRTILRRKHQSSGIDKSFYTGSYGVYFQLVYKPLSWFGIYKKNAFSPTKTRFVFDAERLLEYAVEDMKQHGVKDSRIGEFIYFNMGWYFGKKDGKTISMSSTISDFLHQCQLYTETRNETVIRWIIPCDLEHGLLWIGKPAAYDTTYY
jgi:hypothetical protein